MKSQGWLLREMLGLLAGAVVGGGLAHAGVITPVSGSSSLTVTIPDGWLPEPGQPITIVVNGSSTPPIIRLVCPDATTTTTNTTTSPCPSITTVTKAPTLATSNLPGMCTNFGDPADLRPDFTLSGSQLTPTDCGGRAVIEVEGTVSGVSGTIRRFLIPPDADNDGLPDDWEKKYCTSPSVTCLDPAVDGETGPSLNAEPGDGYRTHDEFRGFIVSPDDATPGFIFFTDAQGNPSATGTQRKHIRTDPTKKDLFIHVRKGECATGVPSVLDTYPAAVAPNTTVTPSAVSGTGVTFTAGTAVFRTSHVGGLIMGTGGGKARITGISGTSDPTVLASIVTADIVEAFPSTAAISSPNWQIKESLFTALYSWLTLTQIHLLSTTGPGISDQWVDKFVSLSIGAPGTSNANLPIFAFADDPNSLDRQVNQNSVVGSPKQRGARLIECLDNQFTDPVGSSSWEPLTSGADNAIVYTRRISNVTTPLGFMDSKISAGGNRKLVVQIKKCVITSAGQSCPWVTIFTGSSPPAQADKDFVKTKYFQYIACMELLHSHKVNPSLGNYGVHDSPDSGDCLGANAQVIISNSPSGNNTFQIPGLVIKPLDLDSFKLH